LHDIFLLILTTGHFFKSYEYITPEGLRGAEVSLSINISPLRSYFKTYLVSDRKLGKTQKKLVIARRFLPKQSHGYLELINGIASSLRSSQRQE